MAAVRTGGRRFRSGPWKFSPEQFPHGWPFGFLLPATTLDSSAFVPSARARRALGTQRVPFWLTINYVLGALVSGDDQVLPVGNFVALALVGTSQQPAPSYQTQWFQLVNDSGQGFRFARIGVIDVNAVGIGTRPFILKHPYPMPNLLSLLNRTANRAAVAQNVQLCVYGVREFVL